MSLRHPERHPGSVPPLRPFPRASPGWRLPSGRDLAAGQPEVREYRMRFWDKGTPNGDWTDIVRITVSP